MRRSIRWLTRIVPAWALVLTLIVCCVYEGGYWLLRSWGALDEELDPFIKIRMITPGVALAGYGFYRAAFFHPFFRNQYRDWLALTPWRWGIPFPLGPVQLVVQDLAVLFLALLLTLGWGHEIRLSPMRMILLGPVLFLGAYLLTNLLALFTVGMPATSLIVGLGLGAIVWMIVDYPISALAASIALYAFYYARLPHVFREFPWDFAAARPSLGWPWDALAPSLGPPPAAWKCVAWPVLLGWWTFAMMVHVPAAERLIVGKFATLCLPAPILIGTAGLMCYYQPPINLWGRLRTLQWIIPRYDVVLIPFCLSLLSALVFHSLIRGGASPLLIMPLSVTTTLLILAFAIRRQGAWRLTCPVRLVTGGYPAGQFERL